MRIRNGSGLSGWLCSLILALALASTVHAQTTQPAAQPAEAAPAAAAPAAPTPDPIGFNGGATTPLLTPNSYLSGWVDRCRGQEP
jgi:hypothetical protein